MPEGINWKKKMSVSKKQWQELNGYIRRDMPCIIPFDNLYDFQKLALVEYWTGEYYDNPILKGKKMAQVFEVLAIQEHTDGSPTTILVPITTVVAKDEQTAVQNFLIENATELKGKDNVQTLCRPFC